MRLSEFKEVDVKKGDLTFGQRIKLGKVVTATNTDEIEKAVQIIDCLHSFRPSKRWLILHAKYLERIVAGLMHWAKTEAELLAYEPTPEEKKAGIKDLSKKIGELGTIKAIAKAYGQDPDTVLTWKYSKVFGILFTDLEEFKYSRKHTEIVLNNGKSGLKL